MRTLYDSVTAFNIPADAQMVAGYVDGRYAWSASDWARFPGAVKVRIACFAWTNDGHVLDVETGDATPAQAPGWVQMRRAAGVDPTVYCSTSWWPSVRSAFVAQGVPEPHYWIAAYPGIGAQLYPGSVAHQYADPGPYDVSVVADYWPGVDGASTVSNVLSATGTLPADLTATLPDALEALMAGPIRFSVDGDPAVWFADLSTGAFYQIPDVESLGVIDQYAKPTVSTANARQRDLIRALCRSAAASVTDPTSLAAAITSALPTGSALSSADVETAVRNVLHGA